MIEGRMLTFMWLAQSWLRVNRAYLVPKLRLLFDKSKE